MNRLPRITAPADAVMEGYAFKPAPEPPIFLPYRRLSRAASVIRHICQPCNARPVTLESRQEVAPQFTVATVDLQYQAFGYHETQKKGNVEVQIDKRIPVFIGQCPGCLRIYILQDSVAQP